MQTQTPELAIASAAIAAIAAFAPWRPKVAPPLWTGNRCRGRPLCLSPCSGVFLFSSGLRLSSRWLGVVVVFMVCEGWAVWSGAAEFWHGAAGDGVQSRPV